MARSMSASASAVDQAVDHAARRVAAEGIGDARRRLRAAREVRERLRDGGRGKEK